MGKIVVIGSANTDLVVKTDRMPSPGETILGGSFMMSGGGKGANQAVALGRLGAPVRMAGRVGDDAFGRRYLDHFRRNGVDVRAVDAVAGTATGVADILVNAAGENCIVIAPGANGLCDLEWLDRALEATADCEIFLLQLEIPLDTVAEAVRRLRKMGKTILLDPAPAVPLPENVLSAVDFLTPNETELKAVTSGLPEDVGIEERVRHLVGGSGRVVVHKRGADGAYIGTRDGIEHVPGFSVRAVDTTAAGDTFNAGLAAGLAMGWPLRDAVRLANAAGALAVTAYGAQEGMPSLEQAQALMARG